MPPFKGNTGSSSSGPPAATQSPPAGGSIPPFRPAPFCAWQHVYSFAQMLLPNGGAKGKRQLDCAGVVTTTYAVCERLAERHGHTDLAGCSMQVGFWGGGEGGMCLYFAHTEC